MDYIVYNRACQAYIFSMDYSEFFVGNPRSKKKEPARLEHDNYSYRAPKKRGGFFTFIIILIMFALTFTLVNILSGKAISRNLLATFTKSARPTYYILCYAVGSEAEAVSKAKTVRSAGGAGFTFTDNGKRCVALAVYNQKSDAEAVNKKNAGTVLVERTFKTADEKLNELISTAFVADDLANRACLNYTAVYYALTFCEK